MLSIKFFLIWICALLISACAVGPDYVPPTTAVPATFSQGAQPEYIHRPTTRWWQDFNDALLNELITQTVQHNHDLEAAQATIRAARALYLEAGLNLLPVISAHGNYTQQQRSKAALNNRSFVPRDLELYNLGFDATWELDFFGKSRRGLRANELQIDAELAQLNDLTISLMAETARNYMQLRGLQHQLAVANKNLNNQQQTLNITQIRLNNGRGTELDTTQAFAQLKATQALIPSLDSAIWQTAHRLSVLTGQAPNALTDKLLKNQALPTLPKHINIGNPAELLRQRADIRTAERNLAIMTEQIGIATADLFPKVSFVGTLALEANQLSGLGATGSDAYAFGPRITWAAFDLGRVYARINFAKAETEASLANYQQTVLTALEETENALVNYNREQQRRALLSIAANASEKANALALLRYQEGVADFLTVLEAEQRLLQDQEQLAQSETATATALIALYKALGGGWETMH
ncbi:efflux transporter outer membrane subunit [Methylocucumis oryzae]|uniref:Membrane protein n=1 Tax=Methylocucumis oryzae TaxID=1632867 RepID=A0A0F3IFR3_9GAMM|nr:efflux transporter outer membrane subunit [Methylocucumis oryzae]KJV05542.1 membrane protein [Methylocucumis oryzae]